MRVFISYSLGAMDQHIAKLLASQAQTKGLIVDSTKHGAPWITPPNQNLNQALLAADVVIAIVSKDSPYLVTVKHELQTAVNLNRPVIALVETGTASFIPLPGLTHVEFDRYDPRPALSSIGQILEDHRNKQNLGTWIVAGGLALLAIYLLSGEEK